MNYGIERYQLRGATPGTTYFVALTIYRDADCTVPEPGLRFPTASFTTNRAGNGSAGATFSAAAVAPLISEPDVLDARWTFSTGAEAGAPVAYETDCVQITVDVPPVAAAPAP